MKGNVYIAGPMRGYPYFNFPKFFEVADKYRKMGYRVFNPAERDIKQYGSRIYESNKRGSLKEASKIGFDLRRALACDTNWICRNADIVVMLPGWQKSKGAKAEHALAEALGLKIIYEKRRS